MNESDTDIIQEILRGGEHGFAVLLQRYRARVLALTLRMIGNREDAEEAAQDAFIRAFRALPGFRQQSRFSTWLYRITYNTALNYVNRKSWNVEVPLEDHHDEPDKERFPADVKIEHEEVAVQVRHALEHLRPEYTTMLTLFYLEDQSYEEIAEITRLPLGTVKNRLHRARTALRSYVLKHHAYLSPTS